MCLPARSAASCCALASSTRCVPPAGTRVITTAKLKALNYAVRSYARAITIDDQYRLPAVIERQLRHHKLNSEDIIAEYTETARREPKKP